MFTQQRKGKYLHFPKFQIKVRSDMYRYYHRWILIKKKANNRQRFETIYY